MRIWQVCTIWISISLQIFCVWPPPKLFEHGSTVLWLSPSADIVGAETSCSYWEKPQILLSGLSGYLVKTDCTSHVEPEFITAEIVRNFRRRLSSCTFVPWKFHARKEKFEPDPTSIETNFIRRIRVQRAPWSMVNGAEEAYALEINEEGEALIQVHSRLGTIHAFNTLVQLFYRHSDTEKVYYTNLVPLKIEDAPTFRHRGLNLDISRNIITPEDVKRTIKGLAFNKFNRLHLHASDAQSWPLEIPSMPELAAEGAYYASQIWTVSDLRDVQSFGMRQGVEVYVEIDMPGHTGSIHPSHPDLLTSFNRKPWDKFSPQPPAGQLKLANKEVDDFVALLLRDLLPRSRPFSDLFHLGGDELPAAAWDMSPSEVRPLLQAFLDHAVNVTQSYGITPVIWEEHVLDYNLTLPENAIIQAWRGSKPDRHSSLAQLVTRGHQALFGSNDHWYLDCGHGGWVDPDPTNPQSPIRSPYLDYCSPMKNWREVLSYKPLDDIPSELHYLVQGGELHLWAEQTDSMNLDRNLWPRVAAAAPVLWNGEGKVGENSTRGLADMRERLNAMGIAAEPVTVTWCLMNPGNCVL